MRSLLTVFLVLLGVSANVLAAEPAAGKGKAVPSSFFDLKTKSLDGKPVELSRYKGQVVLVVNTASECGYTPQYEGLEALYSAKKDKGLVVLGFPSNDFGGQEPGSAEEIAKFCKVRFGVKFPMMEKVKTKGPEQSPVYAFLAAKQGEPKWNFHKYLVGRDGQVKKAFEAGVEPDSEELVSAIDAELAAAAPAAAKK